MISTDPRLTVSQVDHALAAWLGGRPSGFSQSALAGSVSEIISRVEFHGINGLIEDPASGEGWLPEPLQQQLRERRVSQAFWEAQHARILEQVLGSLGKAGLSALLFKGTALAYSHYRQPWMRQRSDSDILVAEREFPEACSVLQQLGFETPMIAGGDVLTAEKSFRIRDPAGGCHDIDLHARLSSSAVLAGLFSHAELLSRSLALAALGPAARRVGDVDSLLIACMHRLVHRHSPYWVSGVAYLSADRMIWLEDIRLLASRMVAQDRAQLGPLAEAKGLARVTADGLDAAQSALGFELPREWLGWCDQRRHERPARYLSSPPAGRLILDFHATQGVRQKAHFLSQLLFPPASYMRAKFGAKNGSWLPMLYLKRASGGLRKLRWKA